MYGSTGHEGLVRHGKTAELYTVDICRLGIKGPTMFSDNYPSRRRAKYIQEESRMF